jgi:hypothetical protein
VRTFSGGKGTGDVQIDQDAHTGEEDVFLPIYFLAKFQVSEQVVHTLATGERDHKNVDGSHGFSSLFLGRNFFFLSVML